MVAFAYRTGGAEMVAPWYTFEVCVKLAGGGGGGGGGGDASFSSDTNGGGGALCSGSAGVDSCADPETGCACWCCDMRIRRVYGSSSSCSGKGSLYEVGGAKEGFGAYPEERGLDDETGCDSSEV